MKKCATESTIGQDLKKLLYNKQLSVIMKYIIVINVKAIKNHLTTKIMNLPNNIIFDKCYLGSIFWLPQNLCYYLHDICDMITTVLYREGGQWRVNNNGTHVNNFFIFNFWLCDSTVIQLYICAVSKSKINSLYHETYKFHVTLNKIVLFQKILQNKDFFDQMRFQHNLDNFENDTNICHLTIINGSK